MPTAGEVGNAPKGRGRGSTGAELETTAGQEGQGPTEAAQVECATGQYQLERAVGWEGASEETEDQSR